MRNRNPDPASHQSDANRDDSILYLYASIVSVHGLPWLHFEPLQLLNFYFHPATDPLLLLMCTRIRNRLHSEVDPDPASQNDADPRDTSGSGFATLLMPVISYVLSVLYSAMYGMLSKLSHIQYI
jgi:hypothetical protein